MMSVVRGLDGARGPAWTVRLHWRPGGFAVRRALDRAIAGGGQCHVARCDWYCNCARRSGVTLTYVHMYLHILGTYLPSP